LSLPTDGGPLRPCNDAVTHKSRPTRRAEETNVNRVKILAGTTSAAIVLTGSGCGATTAATASDAERPDEGSHSVASNEASKAPEVMSPTEAALGHTDPDFVTETARGVTDLQMAQAEAALGHTDPDFVTESRPAAR
jgi:hypothetical protein